MKTIDSGAQSRKGSQVKWNAWVIVGMNNPAQQVSLTNWAPLSLGFASIGSTMMFFNAFDWFFDVVVPFEVFDVVGSFFLFFTACQFEETLVLNLIKEPSFQTCMLILESSTIPTSYSDTPQVPYPCVDQSQPMVSDAYRPSYAECQRDDSPHT
jgi:hypothetical protein